MNESHVKGARILTLANETTIKLDGTINISRVQQVLPFSQDERNGRDFDLNYRSKDGRSSKNQERVCFSNYFNYKLLSFVL
jgi:hypothetical protein